MDKPRGKYRSGKNQNYKGKAGGRKPSHSAAKPSGGPAKKASDSGLIRLNKYVANSGVCSRREADTYIASGNVTVNGKHITEMGFKVKPGDTVRFDGRLLNPEKKEYVLLNKPKNFITTTSDERGRRTVMELISKASKARLLPVGRLDRNTTGLL
ncbi:MAG: RNA-binding S4 domain-containing protein, partial [Eudoraea sp.]|nr:RNA-binding S4 domain-containing protein [Eudoraea sp.]